jgi:hypothetical protein
MFPGMDAQQTQWEEIVEIARRLDHGTAIGKGLDVEAALQLSKAVLEFQQELLRAERARPQE